MRKSASLIMAVLTAGVLVGLLAGCGDSREGQAASKLSEQTYEAQRYYLKAVSQLIEPADMDGREPAGRLSPARPEALRNLQKAESLLTQALSDNPDATRVGQIPAYTLLAEVRQAIGGYHTALARDRFEQAHGAMVRGGQQVGRAKLHLIQEQYYATLAGVTDDEIQRQLAQSQTQAQSLEADQAELAEQAAALDAQVAQAAQVVSDLRHRLIDLRNQTRAASGEQALVLGRQADELERQLIAQSAQIDHAQFAREDIQRDIEQVRSMLQAEQARQQALAARQEQARSLATESLDFQRTQRRAALAALSSQGVEATVQEALRHMQAALTEADHAVRNYEQGLNAMRQAIGGIDERIRRAGEIQRDKPDDMAIVLTSMASQGPKGAALAEQATLALGLGDIRREKVQHLAHAQRFAEGLRETAQAANVQPPAGTGELLQLTGDLQDLREQARASYEAAAGDLERAGSAAMLPRQPVNLQPIRWTYQGQRVRTLYSLYRLTGEDQYRGQAEAIMAEIRDEQGDNPYAQTVLTLDRGTR